MRSEDIKGDLVRRKRSLWGNRRLITTICLASVLCCLGWLGVALGRLWVAASPVRADLLALEVLAASEAQAIDVQVAVKLLHTTRTDLQTLQAAARPFLWLTPYLGWLPGCGSDIQAAPALLEIALDLTAAGEAVVDPLLPFLNEASGQKIEQRELLGESLTALRAARPQLMAALSNILAAQEVRTQIQVERLSPRVQRWMARLDRYLPMMGQGIRAVLVLPELLGVDGPRTFLVLVQNEDELRATGGFISGVARVTVDKGRLLALDFEDSYAVDDFSKPYPDPPQPLLEYMLTELWVFRDSNWSPDFPTSAQAAIDLYTISRDAEIDGVIALDQQAIRLLIEALGPLQVEGYPEPVAGKNVIQMVRRAWDPGGRISDDWWVHRKDFMAAVLEAAAHRLGSGLDRAALTRLARAVVQTLEEKHMLAYLEDREAATLVAELGWDGALLHSPGDYLMVVDTNMGFNKVNALVTERLDYVVDLTELDRPRAKLTIRHSHPLDREGGPCRHEPRYDATYEQMMERCYWDYLRVYVPSGSQLIDATPHPISARELLSGRPSPAQVTVGPPEHEHNVFGTLLLLHPSETLETRLEYALPRDVLEAQDEEVEYTLLVQKQPGTHAIPLRVQISFPSGMALEMSDPEPTLETGSELEYALTLRTDRSLRVTFRVRPYAR